MTINTGITRLLDFELIGNKNLPNGYAGLDGFGLIAASQIPDLFVKTIGDVMTGDLEIHDTFGLRVKDGAQYGYFNQTAGNTFLYGSGSLLFNDVTYPGNISLADLNKFIKKSDVPATYVGAGNKYVCVNGAETALVFVAAGAIPGGPYLPLAGGTLIGDVAVDAGHTIDGIDISTIPSTYLPLTGGTLTGDLLISKSNPLLTIKATDASSPVLDFRDSADNVDAQLYTTVGNDSVLVSENGGLYLATKAATGGAIYLEPKDVTKLAINETDILGYNPITLQEDSAALYFKNTIGTAKGALIPYDTTLDLIAAATQDLRLDTGAAGKSVLARTNGTTRLTVADALITSVTDILINKSSPLLTLKATDATHPTIEFRDSAGNINGTILTDDAGKLVLYNLPGGAQEIQILADGSLGIIAFQGSIGLNTLAVGQIIGFETNDIPRLVIEDTLITSTVDFILLKSNPLLTIKASDASSPVLDFRDSANNVEAQLYSSVANDVVLVANNGGLYLSTAAVTGGSVFLETKGVTRLTIADAGMTAAVPLAMGANKITGLGAATANGDALRWQQRISYSIEVCDNNVGINPADSSTYYFGHHGVAATTTANAQNHLRYVPWTCTCVGARVVMYATTAGTNEAINCYIRKNNTTDFYIGQVAQSATVREFAINPNALTFAGGDTFEIKIVFPSWATNPLGVTFDGILVMGP